MRYRCYFVIGWALASAACSSNEGGAVDAAGMDAAGMSAGGSIACTIDGVSWTSDATTIVAFMNSSLLGVAGSEHPLPNPGRSVNLSVTNVTGPGTYSVANGLQAIVAIGSNEEWVAGPAMGSGTITITTVTASHAKGTFSFVADALTNTSAIGTKTVTAGAFDVEL